MQGYEMEGVEENPAGRSKLSTDGNSGRIFVSIRDDPFEYGVLPHTCKQLGTRILRKTANYVREKDAYPKMSLHQWIRIGTGKMQLPYDLAWAYFRLFDSIIRCQDPLTENGNWDVEVQEAYHRHKDLKSMNKSTVSTFPGTGDKFMIDTSKFLLFLYIQHWRRPYTTLNNASWLHTDTTDCLPQEKKAGIEKKLILGQQCMNFILHQLPDIITFLNQGVEISSGRVKFESIQALDLIIAVSDSKSKIEYTGLEKILKNEEIVEAIGYKTSDHTVDKLKFAKWIQQRLYSNPWSSSASAIVMKNLDVQTGNLSAFPVNELNRVWHNNQNPPKLWFIISTVNEQVFFYDKFKAFTSLKIRRCHNSSLYIPGVFKYVTVEKCRNTTLVLGPVCQVLRFVSCENIKFHGISRSTIIMECLRGDFYLMSLSQPMLCGGRNKNLRLAPYNTFYPNLHNHIQIAGINTNASNLFSVPLDFGYDGQPKEIIQDLSYSLMKAEHFFEGLFPFGKKASSIPFPLPVVYREVTDQRKTKIEALNEEIREALPSVRQRSTFQKIIQTKFLGWLFSNGHEPFLNALESLSDVDRGASSHQQYNPISPPANDFQGKFEEVISKVLYSLDTGRNVPIQWPY